MRVVVALASCLAVLAAAGCGGSGGGVAKGTKTAAGAAAAPRAALVDAGLEPPGGCYVTVLLVGNVTRAQVAQVQSQLLSTAGVTEVAFVSKALELRRLAVLNPSEAKGMHADAFTDRFEVVPSTRGSVVSIAAVKGGPVAGVKPSTGCSGPA